MKTKRGSAVGALIIIVILGITAGVVGWYFNSKTQEVSSQLNAVKTVVNELPQNSQEQLAKIEQQSLAVVQSDAEQQAPVDNTGALKNTVIDAVNMFVKSKKMPWDNKIEISFWSEDKKAVKGKWWAGDAWYWIAWQNSDGSWKVVVAADGFKCSEIDTVPAQYSKFFHNILYVVGSDGKEQKYCSN